MKYPIIFLLAAAFNGGLDAQSKAEPDSLVLGKWSARVAGGYWDLNVESNHQYSIGRVTQPGETLVASLHKVYGPENNDLILRVIIAAAYGQIR